MHRDQATRFTHTKSRRPTFPFEGYTESHADGRIVVSVVSPAARAIKQLSCADADEIGNLLMRYPMPLMWLLESEREPREDDFREARAAFDGRVMLTPDEFPGNLPPLTEADIDAADVARAARDNMGAEYEPEFFGNAVLNDTSLVIVVDCHLAGTQRRRILLTGDQENWSYIASMHPAGLGIDVLKAPHHGGRVYLDDREVAMDRVYVWMRPRSVFVSANGRHKLPRVEFRQALIAVGATLLCPNKRGIEPLVAGTMLKAKQASCFAAYGCSPPSDTTHSVITLRADAESASEYACVQGSGHRGAAPIVVLQQSVVSPSEAFVRWTRAELEKHARWVATQLSEISKAFRQRVPEAERITTSM
ncbi:MAG: MBL fold metallo-hydrolase, partial [Steroidobacteraceae bacterium]